MMCLHPKEHWHAGLDEALREPQADLSEILVREQRARDLYPAGHCVRMTNPVIDGQWVTLGTCACGETFSFPWGEYDRMAAAIEAHWQKYDHLPDKVDGQGFPVVSC